VAILLLGSAGLPGTASATAPGNTAVPGELRTGTTGGPRAAGCRAEVLRLRYIVLFPAGTSADTARAEIDGACGALSGYYPEIAVAVATSADGVFVQRLGQNRAYSAQAEAVSRSVQRRTSVTLPRAVGVQAPAAAATEPAAGDRTREQWDMTMIGIDQSRAVQRGSRAVLVGVLDSGVEASHPDLAGAVDSSASVGCDTGVPDPSPSAWRPSSEHGTHVAGIIAAADDGMGITGVAPGVRIAAVKVVDAKGFIYPEYAVCGFMWAARKGMRVANHSYFVDPWLLTCSNQPGQFVVHEALRRAAAYATAHGVLSVAAAGNDALDLANPTLDVRSPNNAPSPQTRPVDNRCDVLPAELPDVLTVSAVGANGVKSSYSSYGVHVVDIAAPGGDVRQRPPGANSGCVLSTVPSGYGRMCGTSMAAPHVSGVAALVASTHQSAGPAELASLLVSSATPVACPDDGYDPDSDGRADARCGTDDVAAENGVTLGDTARRGNGFYGAGLVNAAAATG
jgi:subtilisin family serine protease